VIGETMVENTKEQSSFQQSKRPSTTTKLPIFGGSIQICEDVIDDAGDNMDLPKRSAGPKSRRSPEEHINGANEETARKRIQLATGSEEHVPAIPINHSKRICIIEGCTTLSRSKHNVCINHGAPNIKKTCNFAGCDKWVQKKGMCIRHGREVAPNIKVIVGCANKGQLKGNDHSSRVKDKSHHIRDNPNTGKSPLLPGRYDPIPTHYASSAKLELERIHMIRTQRERQNSSQRLKYRKRRNSESFFVESDALNVDEGHDEKANGYNGDGVSYSSDDGNNIVDSTADAADAKIGADSCIIETAKTNAPKRPAKKKYECRHEGCTHHAVKGGVGVKHSAPLPKRCSHEDCSNFAKQGGGCKRHGAKNKRKPCNPEGRTTSSWDGEFCDRHGAKVKQKHCAQERYTHCARRGEVCTKHGTDNQNTQMRAMTMEIDAQHSSIQMQQQATQQQLQGVLGSTERGASVAAMPPTLVGSTPPDQFAISSLPPVAAAIGKHQRAADVPPSKQREQWQLELPAQRFRRQLQGLRDMGFTNRLENIRALALGCGDVIQAIQILLPGEEEETFAASMLAGGAGDGNNSWIGL